MVGKSIRRFSIGLFLLLGVSSVSHADTYTYVVQPFLPAAQTAKIYAPMMEYLSKASGHTIELVTSPNFLAYWQDMKKGQFHFMMDAAHLTDYRIKKLGYKPLAKILDVVSLSLVTGPEIQIFEAEELVGKPVASLASPSRGALVIEELFSHPIRQPLLVEVTNAQDAITKTLSGEVHGAIIPTPLVGANPDLNLVSTTDQWPHVAISASSKVPADVANKIRDALLNATKTEAGQAMLSAINVPGFEAATPEAYAGYSDTLKSAWGY